MRMLSKVSSFASSVILKVFFLLELFLFLRLLLKFLGANPKTLVVDWIYRYSDAIVLPFNSIFHNFFWRGYLIEMVAVSAMVGYAIVIFVLLKLLGALDKE